MAAQKKIASGEPKKRVSSNTSDITRYSCPSCEKSYSHNRDLTRHIKASHNKITHLCDQCSMTFFYIGALARHINDVHTQTKSFHCEWCNATFTQKSNLDMHQKEVHTQDKSFTCSDCNLSFARKTDLNRHKKEVHTNTTRGKQNCFRRFFEEVKYGPIFGCICCHIANYYRSVDVVDDSLRNRLKSTPEGSELFSNLIDEAWYDASVQNERKKVFLRIDKDGTGTYEEYICKGCKKTLMENKMPKKCILNECRMALQPDCLRLMTECEVTLIAPNLQFKKIFRLPRSGWGQLRDRVINVPIPTLNIKNTIKRLPRNPSDSGLIGVNWKRKLSYKNTHKRELVDINRVFNALDYLIENNPLYKDSVIDRDFLDSCKLSDPIGHDFFLDPTQAANPSPLLNSDDDELFLNIHSIDEQSSGVFSSSSESSDEDVIDKLDKEYSEFAKTDPIRRFQFDYDEHVALANEMPEAQLDGDNLTRCASTGNADNFADVAPGEGEVPTSVLKEKEWDIKTYPNLYPDGENGMHSEERKVKLSYQQYIKQRLFNVDKRFANDPAYLFSVLTYVEKMQLERNISMLWSYGRKKPGPDNTSVYEVKDAFYVFSKIKGTPQYWKQRKMELHAKLENKGPFQFFFTLSCADCRWDANFTSSMHDLGIKITYQRDTQTDELVTMLTIGEEILSLDDYLKDKRFCNDTRHTQIRKNVLTATRNFDDRAKSFLNHIIMAKANPMNNRLENHRIEFQTRGAAHIHGVLWVNFDAKFPNNIDNCLIKSAFSKFRLDDEMLSTTEENEIVKFIDTFVTVSSDPSEVQYLVLRECEDKYAVAEKAVQIAKTVNKHSHNRACRKYGNKCRFGFDKFPAMRTILTKLSDTFYEQQLCNINSPEERAEWLSKRMSANGNILKHVKDSLAMYDSLDIDSPLLGEMESKTTEQILLEILSAPAVKKYFTPNEDILSRYEEALITSGKTSKSIILKRHPRDRYMNNYNPEWIFTWNANMDIQICLDYFQVISYITDYYSKDDSGAIEYLKKAKKEMAGQNMPQDKQWRHVASTFLSHRRIGEAEALYRIMPDMHLSDSNFKCVYVTTGFPKNRYNFGKHIFGDKSDPQFEGDTTLVTIPGKEGLYKESITLLSKYQRRGTLHNLDKLCYAQFCKEYASFRKQKANTAAESDESAASEEEGDCVTNDQDTMEIPLDVPYDDRIHVAEDAEIYKLPDLIKLRDVQTGEPPYMKRKKTSNAIRIHKIKDKNSHEWLYSQILLYRPFQDESYDLKDALESKEMCEDIFLHPATPTSIAENKDDIKNSNVLKVRHKVMPYIEDVEEAREKIAVLNLETIGTELDAQNAQDNEDCNLIQDELHPDFEVQHPDFFFEGEIPGTNRVNAYQKTDLWDNKQIRIQIRKLDPDQRYVLDHFIKYARTSQLAENGFCPFPSPPNIVIEGDGGSGKSKLIETLCQVLEKEFRRAGDDPEQPYILKGSFTGEAASNIKGLTLTSLFNLGFGNKLSAMSDKMREKKRENLQNLNLLILDEYSMVKSDMLYQIDSRLKEIKINQEWFGGISVILLGNLLQLPPVKANYIFEEPNCESWNLGYQFQSLWELFLPIRLTHNHRQEGEAEFAEMLKRSARGILTDKDVELLETRVVPENDPCIPEDTLYVFALKKTVKKYNEAKLNLLNEESECLQATNILSTRQHFEPKVDHKDGKVKGTPLLNTLHLKKGAKVILIYNVDVGDGLNNGAKGIVLDFVRKENTITHIIVEFENKDAGKSLRQSLLGTIDALNAYPYGVPIPRLTFSYSLSRHQAQDGQKAICIQFPLALGFAMTIHKVEGATIHPPKSVTTDFSEIFGCAQAYTVMGRVKKIEQLFLLKGVFREKIYPSKKALKELRNLERKAINDNCIGRRDDQIKIVCLNVQNLLHHIEDVKFHPKILEHNLIFLCETWLCDQNVSNDSNPFKIPDYTPHYVNVGNGKGVAAYSEPMFNFQTKFYDDKYQIIKFSTSFLHHTNIMVHVDVIGLYRSSTNTNDVKLVRELKTIVNPDKICIICGDFNLRYQTEQNHYVISEILKMKFVQLIDHPSHRQGGIIDHCYLHRPSSYKNVLITWDLFCPFYSDHFGISIALNKKDNPFITTPSTVPDHLVEDSMVQKTTKKNNKEKNNRAKRKAPSSPSVQPKHRN